MPIPPELFEETKAVARRWQEEISHHIGKEEQKLHAMMQRMLKNPINKIFLIELLDQSFRSKNPDRVADQLEYIFEKYKRTDFFSHFEQILIWLFRDVGIYVSSLSVPMFINYLRNDISAIVIQGEDPVLSKHMKARRAEGTRVNINVIGEVVHSEAEAARRVEKYIAMLENPDIDYLSLKISNMFSQILPLAHDNNVAHVSSRLERVYRAAIANPCRDSEEKTQPKFVNLDMEEYRDVRITIDAFKKVLSREEFTQLHAGIVVQAYLPDALTYIRELADWAKARVDAGGAPIKIRIVKGANQEMELTEASLRGWPNVTYAHKAESDANYKKAMDYLLDPAVAPYVHTGVASHNLFDHAMAMLLAKARGVEQYVTAEMLEGMSEAAYRLLKAEGRNVILYAPTATKETFTNAIAYLVRRFDENTAEQNFLRHSFGLKVDTPEWEQLVKTFDDAVALLPSVSEAPNRTQDRTRPVEKIAVDPAVYHFENEPDTDFILPANRAWAEAIRDKWQHIGEREGGFSAYPVIGGRIVQRDETVTVIDKSQYHENKRTGSYVEATPEDMAAAIDTAQADPDGWRKLTPHARQKIMMEVAHAIRVARGDLIGIAAAEVGKVFTETDVEVSEAIDFVNFYPYSVTKLAGLTGVEAKGKGVGLVISPWNFPVAIPTGGIAAALAAGNTVILKPAEASILTAYRLCQCFWEAGVSMNTLQFIPGRGSAVGEHMIPSKAIDFTIFTGGEETAYRIIKARPDIHLSAETGGKDATIVTAMADRDQAIGHVMASAFHNSGQKCSATSLLVLEKELYDDEEYKRQLKEAAESIQTGSVWDFSNRVGTLVDRPAGKLAQALELLDEGEEWLLAPDYADRGNPYMLTPSIRWGTASGDFCHMNELFGPVLSVMRAEDLEDAIGIVNATGYGLTSGLESLDHREQEQWKATLLAGNLYINRGTTGAIVLRQPFGGMRKSAIGSGRKAGGFNYVSQFMDITYRETNLYESCSTPFTDRMRVMLQRDTVFHDECEKALRHLCHFAHWHETEFMKPHDYAHIRGESNVIRYLPVESVLMRLVEGDRLEEALATIMAVRMVGARLHISLPEHSKQAEFLWLESKQASLLGEHDAITRDSEAVFIDRIPHYERVRSLRPENVSPALFDAVADRAVYIAREPFVAHGRIELMHYFIEQSISNSYHRYGNLGIAGLHLEEEV
ncbi:bifunctional proline dehydrogenase/L-glutamate gamma-semialdehyde dehydrogenase [Sulfurimonas sp. HSL1-6]|uniref:bifunctional proline dehydrogenase/L-glutamate gamma-semialdehyde dehydrogenase n=1 Tax=Thiomicrolovo immobilis TaxID=3131935 RepID=UPI0031F73673